MELDMDCYVSLGGTSKKDSVIKPQVVEVCSDERNDFAEGKLIGGPKDIKGGAEE
jgi:hypothetical protein